MYAKDEDSRGQGQPGSVATLVTACRLFLGARSTQCLTLSYQLAATINADPNIEREPTGKSLVDVPIIHSGNQVEGPPTFLGVERIHAPSTASAGVDTILVIFRKTLRVL